MNRFFVLDRRPVGLWLIFLLTTFLFSCKASKDAISETKDSQKHEKLANALLWEISGNELGKKSHLFGTIHIINDEDFFYPQGTLSAIDNVEKMVFEIDMDDMTDMSKAMAMLQKAFMDGGKTLKDLLSDEDYDLVNRHFKRIGLPLFFLERIKPMFLTVFASGDFKPEDLQSGKIKSYEMEFSKIANEKELPTSGLETVEFQISIFDEIPYEDQARMLVETIKSSDTGSNEFKEMIEIYKKQNINAMQTMMKGDETIQEYEDILLVGRNRNWIPIMKNMMAEGPTFFAVGAGHLGGKSGVINLLKAEGYKLKPVIGI